MASHTANAGSSNGKAGETEDHLPTAELTRPSPDAILADEADPDTLLGLESDSDAGSSRPVSMAAAKRASRRVSRRLLDVPLDDGDNVDLTPTRDDFGSQAMEQQHTVMASAAKPAATEEELRAQVTELTAQVTSLNNKLVTSFMRLGDLEDDLSEVQENFTASRAHIASLEKERAQHLAALNTGLLVEKEHVSSEMQKMMERLVQETAEKGKAVSDKQKIESELDELSSSLFSEANKMVASERLARAIADEKSQSMEERLKDTEEIVGQQQKRLVELQALVERHEQQHVSAEPRASEARANKDNSGTGLLARSATIAPSTFTLSLQGREGSTGFLRVDIVPYVELRTFLNHLRRLRLQLAPFYTYPVASMTNDETPIISRTTSPSPLQSSAHSGALSLVPSISNVTSVGASPFMAAGVARHKDFPTLPANVEQLIHLPSQVSSIGFLKRLNEEDCEPCLRLDVAPGLNWLSRRQMQGAILDGSLMIEPIFGGGIYDEEEVRAKAAGAPPAACAMCGKALVNVMLPGGNAATDSSSWMNAASSLQASVSAISSSLPGRDLTASPPPNSSPTGGVSGQRDGAKKTSSIFSTLRNISGGSSASSRLASSPTTTADNTMAQQQAQAHLQTLGVVEDLFARRPPTIPTHIFRISEASTARYLLCPDYCLARVRTTCDFWGYIRNLERAVVLEGKYAWDEEEQPTTAAPRVPTKDDELAKGSLHEETAEDKEASERVEDVPGTIDADAEDADESKDKGTPKVVAMMRKASLTATGSDAGSDFADARSQHSSDGEGGGGDKEKPDEEGGKAEESAKEEEAKEEKTEVAAHEKANNGAESSKASDRDGGEDVDESEEGAADHIHEDGAKKVISSPVPPPRLPRTSRPVPRLPYRVSTPPAPPALPPRRDRPTPATPLSPGVESLGPEPARLLPLQSSEERGSLSWEEKVWREVNQLRADLWSARIGVVPVEK